MHKKIDLGILTGISYVTGLDYYNGINEYFMKNSKPVYSLNPNPSMVFASVDCDKYVKLLEERNFDKVSDHLMDGITKLVNSGCNYLAIASNTGHICYEKVKQKYPDLNIIHIADCIAWELKKKSYYNVGLVGTKPTMEEDTLLDDYNYTVSIQLFLNMLQTELRFMILFVMNYLIMCSRMIQEKEL